MSSHGWTVVAHRVEMLLSLLTWLTRKSSRPPRRDLQVHGFWRARFLWLSHLCVPRMVTFRQGSDSRNTAVETWIWPKLSNLSLIFAEKELSLIFPWSDAASFDVNQRHCARWEAQVHVGYCSSACWFGALISAISSWSCSSGTQLTSTLMVL